MPSDRAQDTEAIRAALGVGCYYAPRIAGLQALGRLVARLEAAEQALEAALRAERSLRAMLEAAVNRAERSEARLGETEQTP